MMKYSVVSKMLGEEKVFLSTFHRCFRRNFNPVYFQMVSGGPDSHTQQLVKGPVIRSIFNHRVEQVIHLGPIISRKGVPAVALSSDADTRILLPVQILHILDACHGCTSARVHRAPDQSPKNLGGRVALPSGKLLRVRKVFARNP